MDRTNKKYKNVIVSTCITANIKAIWQHATHTIDQLTSPSCKEGAIQKNKTKQKLSLQEKY